MVYISMTRDEAACLKAELIAATASTAHSRPWISSLLNALDDGLKNTEVKDAKAQSDRPE